MWTPRADIWSPNRTIQIWLHKLHLSGTRMTLLGKCSSLDVMKGETVCATQVIDELDDSLEQIAEWKSRCHLREAALIQLTAKAQPGQFCRRTQRSDSQYSYSGLRYFSVIQCISQYFYFSQEKYKHYYHKELLHPRHHGTTTTTYTHILSVDSLILVCGPKFLFLLMDNHCHHSHSAATFIG